MKTLKSKIAIFTLLIISAGSLYAQEYDDMYFSAKDRKKVKKVSDKRSFTQELSDVQQFQEKPEESYSARNVNPEYIAKYQAASRENATAEFADNEYFVEDYNDNQFDNNNNFQNPNAIAVRDRFGNVNYFNNYSDIYWSDPFLYQGTIFDPLYRPFYRTGFYNPYGFRSGLSVSVGFGFGAGWYGRSAIGFGTGFGFYDPFWDPYWDPFWCPPAYYGYGWNRWNRWGSPYWGNNVVVINNYETRSNRTFRRGAASSRSTGVVNSRRSAIVNNDNGRSSSGRYAVSNNDRRNFDDAQSRYYRRSRSAVNGSENVTSRSSTTSRSAATNYNPNSRSYNNSSRSSVTRPSSDYSRSSYYNRSNRSTDNTRGSSYNRSATPRGNSSYSRPNSSRSSGYSPSRSSGRSSYGTPSRSSGKSSGISSGSRSSSRSSGSRSSGSRSSGSSRRGNN